jgi:hypothetical protein
LQWKVSLYYSKEGKKVFLILTSIIQMSLLKRFLVAVLLVIYGARTVHHSVTADEGPAVNIV